MKNVDAIIIGTGQTGPSLTERFASVAPLSNGHKFGYSTFDEEVCCEKTNLVLLGAVIWSLGESLSEQSSFEEGGSHEKDTNHGGSGADRRQQFGAVGVAAAGSQAHLWCHRAHGREHARRASRNRQRQRG